MAETEFILTTLPNGLGGDQRLRLSVFVSPRAAPAADGQLPPVLRDWPSQIASDRVSFAVQLRTGIGAPIPAVRTGAAPDSRIWKAVMGRTRVDGPSGPQLAGAGTATTYATYSVSALHTQLKQAHRQVAAAGPAVSAEHVRAAFKDVMSAVRTDPAVVRRAPPGPADLEREHDPARLEQLHVDLSSNLLGDDPTRGFDQRLADAEAVARRRAALAPGIPVPLVQSGRAGASPYVDLVAFHRRPPSQTSSLLPPPTPFDFHAVLTFLADYPAVMRMLGLVIDLELPVGSLPPSSDATPDEIRVFPRFSQPPAAVQMHLPYTAYLLAAPPGGPSVFEAAPAPPPAAPVPPATGAQHPAPTQTVRRLLNLRQAGAFQAINLDVDGGALKAVAMASAAAVGEDVDAGSAPALRTSGVAISRDGQASALLDRMARGSATNAVLMGGQDVTLYAEDLTRGYRFDVHDGRDWRSLHQRVGTVTLTTPPAATIASLADEGTAQPAVTQRVLDGGAQPDPQSPLYIHEFILHWQGWSLAAPRPGKTITSDGIQSVTSSPPPDGVPLRAGVDAAPGTLPRLRFGQEYRFRARAVDLAGNSLTVEEATAVLSALEAAGQHALPVLPAAGETFAYRRYEPIPAPVPVPCDALGEGESLETLVIRSSPTKTAAEYAAALNESRTSSSGRYRATCDRHLAAPKTSQQTAEAHGMLDMSFGAQPTALQRTYNIARKASGTFFDMAVLDVDTGQAVPIPDTTEVDPTTGASHTQASVEQVTSDGQPDPTTRRGYAIHREAQLRLPYLADPIARGAALFGLPGVQAGMAGSVAAGSLVFTPSKLDPDTLATLLGSTLHVEFTGTWPDTAPFRLRLADPEATGQARPPSWDPAARVLTAFLAKAEQATFRLSSQLSPAENPRDLAELELWAWVEELIGPQDPEHENAQRTAFQGGHPLLTPYRVIKLVHAVEAPLSPPQLQTLAATRPAGASYVHIGGTAHIHGKSSAKIELLASWTETVDRPQSPAHAGAPPTTVNRSAHVFEVVIHLPGDEEGEADPHMVPIATYQPEPQDLVTFNAPAAGDQTGRVYLSRQELGDTRHHRISYQLLATTRFREYLPQAVADDPARITAAGNTVTVDVPSSQRPPAPMLVSVLPAFRWTRRQTADGGHESVRAGAIRVYLDRPWYASGEDEQLGVVLTESTYPPPLEVAPLVTHWGQNPLFASPDAPSPPQLTRFLQAASTRTGLSLPEITAVDAHTTVAVAGHPVAYDPDRDLWYADIAIDRLGEESYFPTVRLALARYQPHSLPGLELSPVVLADFVQITPARQVKLTPHPGSPSQFDLLVTGTTYRSGNWPVAPKVSKFDIPEPALGIHFTTEVDDSGQPTDPPDGEPTPSLIAVTVESRIAGTHDDLGWQGPVAGARVTPNTQLPAGGNAGADTTALWSGQIDLPPAHTPGECRIVITEHEQLATDRRDFKTIFASDPDAGQIPGDPDHIVHNPPTLGTLPAGYRFTYEMVPGDPRLVFAETIVV
jgi:hypothetical protein